MTNNPPRWKPPSKYIFWYILKYRKPVPCDDIEKVNRLMGKYEYKRVRNTYIGNYWVSTIFLFLDRSMSNNEPLLFETMVFKNKDMSGKAQYRTTTWRKALKQHWQAVDEVKTLMDKNIQGVKT